MSIKLYSGYKLRNTASPYSLLNEVRENLKPALLLYNFQEVVNEAVLRFDDLKNTDTLRNIFLQTIRDETHPNRKDAYLCKDAQIVLVENPVRNEQYAVYFGLECEDIFAGLPSIASEFGYWDNSDSYPEGVNSDEEWHDRYVAWSESCDLRDGLGNQGLTIRVLSDYDLRGFNSKTILSHESELIFPDDESRAKNIARNLYVANTLVLNDFDTQQEKIENLIDTIMNFDTTPDKQIWLDEAVKYLKPASFALLSD